MPNKIILFALLALSAGSFYPYYLLLVGHFFISLILWGVIKSLQLRPSIVADGHYQYLVILGALGIDGAIVHHCYRSMSLPDLVLSGASLAAPLLSLRVAKRIGVIKAQPMIMPSINRTPHILPSNSVPVATELRTPRSVPAYTTKSQQFDFLPTTTSIIGNRFVFGLPGCGKGIVMSNWIREIKAKFDVAIVYVDPKFDQKEQGYFGGCIDHYHGARLNRMSSAEGLEFIKAGLKLYDDVCDRAEHAYTLLVLDEGTAIGKLFASERDNYLDRKLTEYVSCGDSGGCNVWFVSQSPFMDDLGLKSGSATQLLKLVIARDRDLESLKSWGNSVLMRGINVSEAKSAIASSPVGRAIFWGGDGAGWYAMPELINYSGFDRDTRTVTAARNVEVSATAAAFTAAESLDLPVLDYFAAADPGRPKTVKHLRDSSRLRDRATSKELEDALDRLTSRGDLIRLPDGWILPTWQDNN